MNLLVSHCSFKSVVLTLHPFFTCNRSRLRLRVCENFAWQHKTRRTKATPQRPPSLSSSPPPSPSMPSASHVPSSVLALSSEAVHSDANASSILQSLEPNGWLQRFSNAMVAITLVLVLGACVHSLCLYSRSKWQPLHAPKQVERAQDMPSPGTPASSDEWLRWISLALFTVQSSGLVVLRRYTKLAHADKYANTAVLICTEMTKVALASVFYAVELKAGPVRVVATVWAQRRAALPLVVPASCYVIQQNLLFFAAGKISAPSVQATMQLKIFFTAVLARTLLKKRLSLLQWETVVILLLSIIVMSEQDLSVQSEDTAADAWTHLLGICAAISAAAISALAGILLEKVFVQKMSLWARNVQLALISMPLHGLMMLEFDRIKVAEQGLLHGFHWDTVLLIVVQAVFGLVVAVVIKYAGNVAKNFANGGSLVLTNFLGMYLFALHPTSAFWIGVLCVCIAPVLYSLSPILYSRSATRFDDDDQGANS